MADEPVLVDVEGGIASVTLNDPDNRNALSAPVIRGLMAALDEAQADDATRVVLLTNRGSTFCAGADLKAQSGEETGDEVGAPGFDVVLAAIQDSPVPVVGRIDGHAVGGGMGLVAACDISIARDDVKMGFTEVRLGVAPAIISVVCLPKMRPGEAREAFLRGNRFPPAHAAELGLINRAVPAAELDAAVAEVTEDLLLGGPDALGAAKRMIAEVPAMGRDQAFSEMARVSAELFAGEEAQAGMAAFLNREPPPWAPSDGG